MRYLRLVYWEIRREGEERRWGSVGERLQTEKEEATWWYTPIYCRITFQGSSEVHNELPRHTRGIDDRWEGNGMEQNTNENAKNEREYEMKNQKETKTKTKWMNKTMNEY